MAFDDVPGPAVAAHIGENGGDQVKLVFISFLGVLGESIGFDAPELPKGICAAAGSHDRFEEDVEIFGVICIKNGKAGRDLAVVIRQDIRVRAVEAVRKK